jgi:hypothetical protein
MRLRMRSAGAAQPEDKLQKLTDRRGQPFRVPRLREVMLPNLFSEAFASEEDASRILAESATATLCRKRPINYPQRQRIVSASAVSICSLQRV